jgi:hypothetical protein
VLLGFNQATCHPSAPWIQPSHLPPQCSLDSTKSPVYPSAPLDSSKPPVHLGTPLDYLSHRSTLVFLGFNQATSPPQCSLRLIQATDPPRCSLGLSKPPVHPSAPWIQPSHQSTLVLLGSTKSLATPVLLGFNQVTGHPSAPWIQPSHRSTPVLLGINQVTVYPNAPWNQPSHWPPSWSCSSPLHKFAM